MNCQIRPAIESDLEAINAIFNHYVLTSTCTWQDEPISMADRRTWWAEKAGRFPILVAVVGGRVVGFTTAGQFRPRSGYRYSAENSIYLDPDACGKGIGKALLTALLAELKSRGFHTVIASMSDDQEASIRLHRSLGFEQVGHMRETGFKFGRWHSGVFMQKML